jgi:hypothetical protein
MYTPSAHNRTTTTPTPTPTPTPTAVPVGVRCALADAGADATGAAVTEEVGVWVKDFISTGLAIELVADAVLAELDSTNDD